MSAPSRVLLLTRSGCHLCEEAEQVVARVCEAGGVGWRSVDIDTDAALKATYTNHVPVLFVDDVLLGYWRVDADQLEQALGSTNG